jgi:hypothetical protein
VAAVSALISVIDANKRTRALTETNNNLNFVLQSMVREIRNGFNYGCDQSDPAAVGDCPNNGGTKFGFINSAREKAEFKLNNQNIVDENGNAITPEQVDITHLRFRVVGSENDNEQSRVQIAIQAEAGASDARQELNLQTTATQRLLYTPTSP